MPLSIIIPAYNEADTIGVWRSLLAQLVPATYRNVGITLIVGYAVNNILPARLGEFLRAARSASVIPGSYGLSAFALVAASGLVLFGIAIAVVIIGGGHAHRVTALPD